MGIYYSIQCLDGVLFKSILSLCIHVCVCVCVCVHVILPQSPSGLMALFFSCSIFVSLMYLILIHIHNRFSRSAGITNQGQDYNLDSSYYIIKGYRTNSKMMNLIYAHHSSC